MLSNLECMSMLSWLGKLDISIFLPLLTLTFFLLFGIYVRCLKLLNVH